MSLIDFIYGLGIFQGASLFLVLVFIKTTNRQVNLIMAALILVLVFGLAHNWLLKIGYFFNSPGLALLHMPADYLIGPMLYFYGLSFTNAKFHRAQLFHFALAAFTILPTFVFWNMDYEDQLALLKYTWFREGEFSDIDTSALIFPSIWELWITKSLQGNIFSLHLGFYCLLLHKVIQRNRLQLKTQYSSIEERDLAWLAKLNLAIIFYLVMFIVFNRIPRLILTPDDPANFSPNFIIVLIVQIIALVSLWQPNIIHGKQDQSSNDSESKPKEDHNAQEHVEDSKPLAKTEPEAEEDPEKSKYKRSGLTLEVAQEYRILVMKAMNEKKLFLDCELTLNDLAKEVDIPTHQLSEVLNGQLNQNFYSFVNDYRVQYAKELLTTEKTRSMAIIDLAFEAGFRSKSSFYDAFKKATNMTPTQFKKLNATSVSPS